MQDSPLQRAVQDGLATGDLATALARVADVPISTGEDAAAIAELLDGFLHDRPETLAAPSPAAVSPLQLILGLFQQIETEEAYLVLVERGLPNLRQLFDRLIAEPIEPERADDLLFLVKIFALYREEQDVERIGAAARTAALEDRSLWPVIFETFDEEHPLRSVVVDALRDPLPTGFAGVAFLDFANAFARDESIEHPFDSPAGHARLERLLTDPDSERFSFAHSAAAALPFVSEPPRGPLLALGLDHPSKRVQLESAWASARIGSRAGIEFLSRACLDVTVSATAVAYLEELLELNAIPARAKDPAFMAVADLCRWLSHPMEYGRPPDGAELLDTRTLFWPPVNEPRRLWLVKYRYEGELPDGRDDVGVGLVGSITFVLFGETEPDMPPEDVYALHCCWELEVEYDPRAPEPRSIEAGRQLLRDAGNDNF